MPRLPVSNEFIVRGFMFLHEFELLSIVKYLTGDTKKIVLFALSDSACTREHLYYLLIKDLLYFCVTQFCPTLHIKLLTFFTNILRIIGHDLKIET